MMFVAKMIASWVTTFTVASALAAVATPEDVTVAAYAQHVFTRYSETLSEAKILEQKIKAFIAAPTAENLKAAQEQWVKARKLYSTTEVFRFYSGPIDQEGGPEGLLNAWPLDEAYIDYVRGDASAGFINDTLNFPSLTKDILVELNEKDGEKNISVGWHAIEFMLWGQDLNLNGPAQRPVSDFISAPNADRRRQYLSVLSELLVEHLGQVTRQWTPGVTSNYAATFTAPAKNEESLGFILTGAVQLSGFELSQERMFVAYDTQLQEDEHSCFSDTTHLDILYNFTGIREVLQTGPMSTLELVRAKDAALAQKIEASLLSTEKEIRNIPAPFDQAIFSDEGRTAILASVTELEALSALLKQGAVVLGVQLL